MTTFDIQAIEIRADPKHVFEFVRNPANLPKWTHAFRSADNERAQLETPAGSIEVGLRTEANLSAGTVDWRLAFPGGTVALAHSRVTETTRDTCIYAFVLHAPPVPLEQVEGALDQQSATLRDELATLRRLMET